jgi:cellulose synthase/poly-beta-1,6-N-acetylglucosamine synthase-like glycosyltransferase
VASQLGPKDEYIVVDDGSTDNTAALIADAPPTVRAIRQRNAGEAAAVNAGVALTRAEIIGVVNADDPILHGLLDRVRETFAADPTLAAVYPDWRRIDQKGRTINLVRTFEYDYGVMLAQHLCIPGPGAFFRRSVLGGEPVRDDRARGISDFDFWLRFGLFGATVRRIPDVLATWRMHRGGTTYTFQSPALAAAKVAMVDRLFSRPDLPDDVRALRAQAMSAAAYHAALVGLRGQGVPALRYIARSYWLDPRWPAGVLQPMRRSAPHLAYAALQPLSGRLHDIIGPLLPAKFRRTAVLDQTFGHDVSTDC